MPDKKILIIAGETSGDLHGARLVEDLLEDCPGLSVYGIGGDEMKRAGVRLSYHASELAVVGLVEVFGRLRTITRAFRTIKRSLSEDRPDLVVLIDFPDFNLRVARHAARRGIPVVYYISPQIWAWRRSRVRQIAKDVTRMIVIFPFEETLYREHDVPVTYVGHPLMDRFDPDTVEEKPERAGELSGLMCMAISGGAIVPLLMGGLVDAGMNAISFVVPLVCFIYLFVLSLKGGKVSA